jgi:4-methyl-5(b-hydroxyethyl)-thiazole monophosphate biosynthesis
MSYCVFLGDGFEDVEAVAVIDVLRRARVTVDIYGVGREEITSRSHLVYKAEKIFRTKEEIDLQEYEGILLVGNTELLSVIKAFHAAGKLVFAICAAPRLLDAAGVLEGRRYTCYPNTPVRNGTRVDQPVVVDGNIVTSQGVGTALAAALKLVEIIISRSEAGTQAKKILFRN